MMSHRRHRRHSSHPRCVWTFNGWTCRYRVMEVLANGNKVRCRFCPGHQCVKNEGGMPCGVATVAGFKFCQNHSRCTAVSNGTRCANYVKGMDANKYRYCAQIHNCATEDCDQPRAPADVETSPVHCPTHRCPLPTCRNPRLPQGPYCTTHTCAGPNCSALCTGGGPPGSHTRYCDRHRVCASQDCTRLCHTRENGVPASHCGMHYCRAEGCNRERRGDEACVMHSCAEVGCGRRRNGGAEGVFCKGHECKSAACVFRRRRGDLCAEHVCARRSCEGEAEGNGYCEKHQLCVVVGCERYRAVAGERILERCEYHEGTICASQPCTLKATPPNLFCPLHLCSSPTCPNPTTPPLTLCPSHKCALPHGSSPRWTGTAPSPFCAQHACRYPSCGDRADGGTGRCREHGRCRVEGCRRIGEEEGYCGEHRRRGCVGYQDQWAGWGVAI